jgi:hypothetical protein
MHDAWKKEGRWSYLESWFSFRKLKRIVWCVVVFILLALLFARCMLNCIPHTARATALSNRTPYTAIFPPRTPQITPVVISNVALPNDIRQAVWGWSAQTPRGAPWSNAYHRRCSQECNAAGYWRQWWIIEHCMSSWSPSQNMIRFVTADHAGTFALTRRIDGRWERRSGKDKRFVFPEYDAISAASCAGREAG